MQRKSKTMKKNLENKISLARSLSARISPLSLLKQNLPGSFDMNFIIKKQIRSPTLQIPQKNAKSSGNIGSQNSNYQSKKSFDKNSSTEKKKINKKNERISLITLDAQEKNNYLNDLKKEVWEIMSENKKFEKIIEERKNSNKKVLAQVIENFKSKLQNKLSVI